MDMLCSAFNLRKKLSLTSAIPVEGRDGVDAEDAAALSAREEEGVLQTALGIARHFDRFGAIHDDKVK